MIVFTLLDESLGLVFSEETLIGYNNLMKTLKNGEYEYKETDFLGEGSFAKVYRGLIVKTERVVAVRLLPLKLIKQYGNKIKTIISTICLTEAVRCQCSRNWLRLRTSTTCSQLESSTASLPTTTSS